MCGSEGGWMGVKVGVRVSACAGAASPHRTWVEGWERVRACSQLPQPLAQSLSPATHLPCASLTCSRAAARSASTAAARSAAAAARAAATASSAAAAAACKRWTASDSWRCSARLSSALCPSTRRCTWGRGEGVSVELRQSPGSGL